MKSGNSSDVVYKEVVVIGNGPSGIAMSYLLSGHLPYLISDLHPDELLSARLSMVKNPSLVHQELVHLAADLEGRSTNPVSLLLDALIHPYADIGLEMESLVEWRKNGVEIEHIVVGKGPPGGSWHTMDPHILTLSLGTWMALPGFQYQARDGMEKRASAGNVARYYEQYVKKLNLTHNFKSGVLVTRITPIEEDSGQVRIKKKVSKPLERLSSENERWVQRIDKDISDRAKLCSSPEAEESFLTDQKVKQKSCLFPNPFSFIRSQARQCKKDRCCKRRRDAVSKHDLSPDRKIREVLEHSVSLNEDDSITLRSFSPRDKNNAVSIEHISLKALTRPDAFDFRSKQNRGRSISFSCDFDSFKACDSLYSDEQNSLFESLKNSHSLNFNKVPNSRDCESNLLKSNQRCNSYSSNSHSSIAEDTTSNTKWQVEVYDPTTKSLTTYVCKYLVLANGASDLPNRLTISEAKKDPDWLLHDLPSLENELDRYVVNHTFAPDPVLVVGAGLSAADAIIATRGRNIPVLHVFRNRSAKMSKQLPENMYPEYHKVHQMMQDGGSSYPLYTALPECTLIDFNESERTVALKSNSGEIVKYQVSFAIVLIGSRPDLSFLPENYNLGVNKNLAVDCKTNTININKLTHAVVGFDNLYGMGPLAGDHFVRFIPGGALAIVSDLYRKHGF